MIYLFILQCGVLLWYLFKNVRDSFNPEKKVKTGDWYFKVTEEFNIYGFQNDTGVEIVTKEEIDPSLLQHLE